MWYWIVGIVAYVAVGEYLRLRFINTGDYKPRFYTPPRLAYMVVWGIGLLALVCFFVLIRVATFLFPYDPDHRYDRSYR